MIKSSKGLGYLANVMHIVGATAVLTFAAPAYGGTTAASDDIFVTEPGAPPLVVAMQVCTSWIVEPASWAEGKEKFAEKTGLDKSGLQSVSTVPPVALPPPFARRNMHHWRVGDEDEGYAITTSNAVPVCHFVGAGTTDLLPTIEMAFSADGYQRVWTQNGVRKQGNVTTRSFSFRPNPKIVLHISYVSKADNPEGKPQMMATMLYNMER